METEVSEKKSGMRITVIVILSVLSAILIYYTVMSVLSPGKKLREMQQESTAISSDQPETDARLTSDSTYLKLLKEKAFLQSRTLMAETDSIYVTINLADSIVNIEISGVAVHNSKMSYYKSSSMFLKGNKNSVLSILSTPFTIAGSYSTIRKEPLMIKIAPKDTSEYKPDIMPDTSITEPVNYILEMTDGTRIYVYQEETEKLGFRMSRFKFELADRLRETWKSIKSVTTFKIPDYHPYIKIRLPRADAKIIYRAIPKNGQIAIYME